jgi:hypothetical protein
MDKLEEHTALVRKRCLSDIETGDDGYKCWWPLHGSGSLNAIDLRIIADYLDELNKEWDEEVQKL